MKILLRRLVILVLLLAVGAASLALDAHQQLRRPLAIESHQRFELPAGSRLRDAVQAMREAGLFGHWRQALYLEAWGRLSGQAARIKAGEYSLDPGLSGLDMLSLWVGGKTLLHELRIIEGMRFDQALDIVLGHPELQRTLDDTRPEAVMAALGEAGQHPEGRFFPDTYRFPRGTTEIEVLRQALQAMDRLVAQTWSERRPDLPYAAPGDMLTLASIVEKETGLAAERERIAGVFVRRLQRGMRLQTDPTVIYGLGEAFDGNLRRRDLLADTPYNTYTREGLPPTPICLPGRAALQAAVRPAPGTELYFVSRGDGSHQFSTTLAEHNAAVRKYQLGGGS